MNIQHRHNRGSGRGCQEEVTNFSFVCAQEELTINKYSKRNIKLFCSKTTYFQMRFTAPGETKRMYVLLKTRVGGPFNIECQEILTFTQLTSPGNLYTNEWVQQMKVNSNSVVLFIEWCTETNAYGVHTFWVHFGNHRLLTLRRWNYTTEIPNFVQYMHESFLYKATM